jgi:hypothetical protein
MIPALVLAITLFEQRTHSRYRASSRSTSNQTLERTADRRDNLLSMTSIVKREAQLALVSGRSAFSR